MRIGILGSGMIVNTALSSLKNVEEIKVTALWARASDQDKAKSLQETYGIANIYDEVADFLADDSYDVVYVGLINSVHFEYAKMALEANKHVICEKPFTTNKEQAQELYELAKKKSLFLFEAILLRYLDNYEKIRTSLPELGQITVVNCNYSQYSSRFDAYQANTILPAFDPALCGGALYDINVYCLHFTIGLFGKPQGLNYFANIGHNGIDTSGVAVLDYGDFKAICIGAKDSNSLPYCSIQGHNGFMHTQSMPGSPENVQLVLNKQEPLAITGLNEGNIMVNEFLKIAAIIGDNDLEKCYGYLKITTDVMDVLEQARIQAKIPFPDI